MKNNITILINVLPKEKYILQRCLESLGEYKNSVQLHDGVQNHIGKARYDSLNNIKTKYICWVDPDDKVNPEAITACIEELEKNELLCGVYTNELFTSHIIKNRNNFFNNLEWKMENQLHPHCVHGLCVMRNDLVQKEKEILLQYPNMAERVLCAAIAVNNDWMHIDKMGYYWSINNNSSRRKISPLNQIKAIKQIAKYVLLKENQNKTV